MKRQTVKAALTATKPNNKNNSALKTPKTAFKNSFIIINA